MSEPCRLCFEPFTPRRQGWPHRYCSVLCRTRAKNMRALRGLQPEQFRALWREQGGLCGMPGCLRALVVGQTGCHIDHDHSTGRVRGLLCHPCNVGLGHVESLLPKGALEYLMGGDVNEPV